MNDLDHEWLRRTRDLLEASTQALDAETLSRLNRARQAALASRRRRLAPMWGGFAVAGASAMALALAIGLQRPPPEPASTPASLESPAAISTGDDGDDDLLAADDLEFFEDLDFYQWLDSEGLAPAPSAPNPGRPL